MPAARKVPMTGIPQMVAIFNGVGGGAAAVISLDRVPVLPASRGAQRKRGRGPLRAGCGVPFVFRQRGGLRQAPGADDGPARRVPGPTGGQRASSPWPSSALGVVIVVAPHLWAILLLAVVALALGAGVVLPVGGADTPVLISLLNSFTGLAVAADGFVLDNVILVVAGTLVGASGALLTKMMSDAMGRSLPNIVLGGFGAAPAGGGRRGAGTEGAASAAATPPTSGPCWPTPARS